MKETSVPPFIVEECLPELKNYRLADYLKDIEDGLEACGLKRAVLLGYSHTAFFMVHFALAHVDRVAALVLLEPALFNDRDELLCRARTALEGDNEGSLKHMLKAVQPNVGEDPNLADHTARFIMKLVRDPRSVAGELIVRANHPVTDDQLASLPFPVLLIGGTASHASYTVKKFARILPSAYVWWIKGATHGDLTTDHCADETNKVIGLFMKSIGEA